MSSNEDRPALHSSFIVAREFGSVGWSNGKKGIGGIELGGGGDAEGGAAGVFCAVADEV